MTSPNISNLELLYLSGSLESKDPELSSVTVPSPSLLNSTTGVLLKIIGAYALATNAPGRGLVRLLEDEIKKGREVCG